MSAGKAADYPGQAFKKFRPKDLIWSMSLDKVTGALEENQSLTIKELEVITDISTGKLRTVIAKLIGSGRIVKRKSSTSKQAFIYELACSACDNSQG